MGTQRLGQPQAYPPFHPPGQPSWVLPHPRPTPTLAMWLALPRSPPSSSAERRWPSAKMTGPATASPADGARLPRDGLVGHPLGASLHERTPPVGPDRDRLVAGGAQALVAPIPVLPERVATRAEVLPGPVAQTRTSLWYSLAGSFEAADQQCIWNPDHLA